MTTKHTPGPWAVTLTPAGKAKVVDSHGFSIANATGGTYAQGHIDARLIAAAPELYDAAMNALETLVGCCVSAGGLDDRATILATQKMLREAIAKAEGRS